MELKQALKPLSNKVRLVTPMVQPLAGVVDLLAPKPNQFLQDNFADTYWSLRAWMAAISLAFPVAIPWSDGSATAFLGKTP